MSFLVVGKAVISHQILENICLVADEILLFCIDGTISSSLYFFNCSFISAINNGIIIESFTKTL